MKKLIFTLFVFLCVVISSKAQTYSTSDEFYSYLNSILKDKNNTSIELVGTNYGAMSSKFHWNAKLKRDGNKIAIQYNTQKPEEEDLIVMKLDTTFVTTQKKLIDKFKTEINAGKSRPVYFEEIVKVDVNTEHSNKEFTLKIADGLSFLLRYNKSFEQYYKEKGEK